MNMNLLLDREAAVLLRTLHKEFPHPYLSSPYLQRGGGWAVWHKPEIVQVSGIPRTLGWGVLP